MEKKDTRAEIVRVGTDLIACQGFNATGIEQILKESGVPKGSFYHHFRSKEDFGLAVIDRFAEKYDRKLATFLDDPTIPPLERIRRYLENGLENLTAGCCTRGCLIGNLGQELADINERFRERLDAVFREWKARLAACIREARERGQLSTQVDPDVLAGVILSGYEGAILRLKVNKSPQPLRDFIDVLFAAILK